jgi:O-antigen/teichoic acid export membrane protein
MSLKRNTLWNLAGSGLPLIAAAGLIPFTLHRLGNEAFGVLTLIWALIGYFSLFDMGVGRALTYELSKLRAKNDDVNVPCLLNDNQKHIEISLTLKAGLLITLAAGGFGAVLMLLLSPSLATNWLKISPALQQDALYAFQIAALGIIPTTLTSGLRGALEGLERFASSNINKLILGFCMFALPALSVILHGNQLWYIALYLVLTRIIIMLLSIFQLKAYLFDEQGIFSSHAFSNIKTRVKPLLNYGIWMTVSGIISPLMVTGDRFFVSAAVGAAILPLYAIPQEGLQRLLILPAALCGALMPQFSALTAHAAKELYLKNYKRVAFVMLGFCVFSAIVIYPFLSFWISTDFADKAFHIALVLCLGIWLNSIAFVPYTFLHANGKTKATALFHLFELVFYAVTLWFLVNQFGLIGAAWAWVLRVALDLILLSVLTNKILKKTVL